METQYEKICSAGTVLVGTELGGQYGTTAAPAISGGGDLPLNVGLSNTFRVALNHAISTITFSNIPATGKDIQVSLRFTADGTPRAITWPASVRWPSGSAPIMTSTNNKVDWIVLISVDNGTTWDGFVMGQNL
jgi:hypothetical protein